MIFIIKVEFLPDILKIVQQLLHSHLLARLVHDVVHLLKVVIVPWHMKYEVDPASSSKLWRLRLSRSESLVSSLMMNCTWLVAVSYTHLTLPTKA